MVFNFKRKQERKTTQPEIRHPISERAVAFRVSNFSEDQDERLAKESLISKLKELGTTEENNEDSVHMIPNCLRPSEWMAIVVFKKGRPSFLKDQHDSQINGGVTFESTFHGFTQLYPTSGNKIVADFIAVTGIGGHAFGSWVGRSSGDMWLSDYLRKDFPDCRVLTYGYGSKLGSRSHDTILSFGDGFLARLNGIRSTEQEKLRPIILIGHSFGGLVISHALTEHDQRSDELRKHVRGILLFGTPHTGLKVDDLRRLILNNITSDDATHPQQRLLDSIDPNAETLVVRVRQLKDALGNASPPVQIVSCYETHETRTVNWDSRTKAWMRTGPYRLVVPESSALLGLSTVSERRIPIESDHSNMVKFNDQNSSPYDIIYSELKQILQRVETEVDQHDVLEQQLNIANKISGLRFDAEYEEIYGQRTVGTGAWLCEEETFQVWRDFRDERHLFWVFGEPGAGKTFLSTFAIRHLSLIAPVAYIYCNHTVKYTVREYLASIFAQFLALIPMEQSVRTRWIKGSTRLPLSVDDLKDMLAQHTSASGQIGYIVLDALDESSRSNELVMALRYVLSASNNSLRLFLTSRHNYENLVVSSEDAMCRMSDGEKMFNDISKYIDECFSANKEDFSFLHSTFRVLDQAEQAKMKRTIVHYSGSKFIIARLVMRSLALSTSAADLRDAISSLKERKATLLAALMPHFLLDRFRLQKTRS